MAIRTVNGQKVYVLEPTPFNAKAPSGASWSTLYSDLRWQVWEDIQKNEAAKMKLEAMNFEAQRDYYNDQKKFLRNQIADLKKIQLRAAEGGSDAIDQSLRAAEILARGAGRTAGSRAPSGPRITERKSPVFDKWGTPVIDEVTGKQLMDTTISVSRPAVEGEINPVTGQAFPAGSFVSAEVGKATGQGLSPQVKTMLEGVITKGSQALQGGDAKGGGTTISIEDEIEKLETELSLLQAPQLNLDTDLLNRSQRAFESQVGVMGQGGGIFGLAPRPRREAPRVDQPLARQRGDEFIAAVEEERASREADKLALNKLYQESAALRQLGLTEVPEEGQASISDQINAINQRLSAPTLVEQALSDPRFKERKPGEFLLRRAEADFLGVPSEELVSEVPPPAPAAPPAPPRAEERAIEKADKALELSRNPIGRLPLRDTFRLPTLDASGMPIEPVEMAIPRGRVEVAQEVIPPRAPTEQSLQKGLNTAPSIQPLPPPPPQAPRLDRGQAKTREQAVKEFQIQYGPIKVDADSGTSEMLPVDPKVNEQIYKAYIEEGLFFESDAAGRSWYQNKLKEVTAPPAPPQASKPTPKQRKDMYALTITADGLKLAEQPKKLERLARTKEDAAARPSHYTLVDQIYDINKGKSNAFKVSFDEISRVFANDPQKRKEAHTYLVAKDSLEVGKAEPQV